MGILDLFIAASMPVLKVLLVTALGSFLASEHIDILGEDTRKQLNKLVFFVFNPALVSSNLAKTITSESILLLWFMPLNILLTFIIGSALGWILVKITRPPQHLKGLILGSCAAGNLGNLPIIIIPAICKEQGSPFGAPDVCQTHGMAYASLSMAMGSIFLWSYVYNIVRMFSNNISEVNDDNSVIIKKSTGKTPKPFQGNCTEPLLPSNNCSSVDHENGCTLTSTKSKGTAEVLIADTIKERLRLLLIKLNVKALCAPSIIGAISGFTIGIISPLRKSLIGGSAHLRVVQDSALWLGDAAIPTVTLIIGGNLLRGLRVSGIRSSLMVGIIAVRYIFLPLLGIVIVKGAVHFGLVHPDPLYQFVLLLQFALPPAMNIGTITQLFGAGESECSVILLWTYALAPVSLTLWPTFFLWLVS